MRNIIWTCLFLWTTWVHAAIKPADGLWRSTDDPDIGSGLMMITQGDITLVSVYSYTDAGQPRWYLAVGHVDENGLFVADLTETHQGTYLTASNPPSANYIEQSRQIEIQFTGTQTASFSIDASDLKAIQPYHFVASAFQTEHHQLSDGSPYTVPDLSGSWAVGQLVGQDSFMLMLDEVVAEPPGPYPERTYISSHRTTENWMLRCPHQLTDDLVPSTQSHCVLESSDDNLGDLRIPFKDLGYDRMELATVQGNNDFIGRRAYHDQLVRPANGYWRPEDDPEVGSGMVMTTQGDTTVVLVYSYDAAGLPSWQIASGQFDDTGLLETTLLSTQGGSPIEIDEKFSATFTGDSQSLVIQLIGTELATFSIDESEPKHIQVFNFGAAVLSTSVYQVGGKNFQFPTPEGRWVYYARSHPNVSARNTDVTAIEEGLGELQYRAIYDYDSGYLSPVGLRFNCFLEQMGQATTACEGYYLGADYIQSLFTRFEMIGYQRIMAFQGLPDDERQNRATHEIIRLE